MSDDAEEITIPLAIVDEIDSWGRVLRAARPDNAAELFGKASAMLWETFAVCQTVESKLSQAVAQQAIVDALAEFAERVGLDVDQAQEIIAAAKAAGVNGHAAERVLPQILIEGGNRHIAWRQARDALIESGAQVFYRGQTLVTPLARLESSTIGRRAAISTIAQRLSVGMLADITRQHAARFVKKARSKKTEEKFSEINPPEKVIQCILEFAFESGFPTLAGIIDTPTLRPDGSLLEQPGYDAATQLFYRPAADLKKLPPIPERPTRQEALEALELFKALLVGFPFVHAADLAVAIAGILTVVLRGAIDHAPMFLVLAPEPGTGKTFLVQVIVTIASGREIPAVVGSSNGEEMEKRLSAAAFETPPILHLNNLSFDLGPDHGGDILCQLITDGYISVRPLGRSDQIRIDCRAMTIFANGNNIHVKGDLVRRTVTANLNAKSERPESRAFTFNPIDLVRADRAKYVRAAIIIARAYLTADNPVRTWPLAGFKAWSRFVREPLIWLGCTDPASTIEGAKQLDPDRSDLRDLLEQLRDRFSFGVEFTAQDCAVAANDINAIDRRPKYPEFAERMRNRDGKISTRSIGRLLSKNVDRRASGLWLELVATDRTTHSGARYRVCREGERHE